MPGTNAHDCQNCEHPCRTNIDIDDTLIRKARRLTRLKTKRQIVDKALELLVRSESRKGILRYYGSGVWKGDLKGSQWEMRANGKQPQERPVVIANWSG